MVAEGAVVSAWAEPLVWQVLYLWTLLWLGERVVAGVPALARLRFPGALIGGLLGLIAGPGLLGWIALDAPTLELGIYHGLGVLFVAVGLEASGAQAVGRGARSWARAMPLVGAAQCVVGAAVVLAAAAWQGEGTHAGLALLLPLGFMQGPGQALVLGGAWEATGLVEGAQTGLFVAALGFLWSALLTVPLVRWAGPDPGRSLASAAGPALSSSAPGTAAGLSHALATVAVLYLVTGFVVRGMVAVGPGGGQAEATLGGFHFLVGLILALVFGRALRSVGWSPGHREMRQLSGVAVDGMTCAAIAALEPTTLRTHVVVVLVYTTIGAFVTLAVCLWVCCRAFEREPLAHAVLMFASATGTLPSGLALLRMVDPELEGEAPTHAVMGTAGSLWYGAPAAMLLLPAVVLGWPGPVVLWAGLVVLPLFAGALLVAWVRSGDLELGDAPWALWRPGR
jgi:ESS family glutamate:Na+ symporter